LNLQGDGQGDLMGTAGSIARCSSISSIRTATGRSTETDDFVYGQFGENFTVEGLTTPRIGDR
jgi:hypothetical protein